MCSNMGHGELKFFVLDLSSSGSVNRCATVRLDGNVFSRWSFCILGSILYGFEGADMETNAGGKTIYKYELPSDDEANIELESYMFTRVCEMKVRKTFPEALICPNGKKVVVFSRHTDETRTSFELFDPVRRCCSTVYDIPSSASCSNFRVRSHSFISDTEFFLGMDHGMFKIDIRHSKPKWKELDNFYGGVTPRTYYKVIGNDLCLTPTCAYSIIGLDCRSAPYKAGEKRAYSSEFKWNYYYPDSSPIALGYECVAQSIIVLRGGGEDSNLCEFCILKAGENSTTGEVMVTLDVYECHLFGCRIALLRDYENEEIQAQEKIEQMQKWKDELPGEYDAEKYFEYCRKRNSLMGKRECRPLPYTRLKISSCFTFKTNEFSLMDFSSISPIF